MPLHRRLAVAAAASALVLPVTAGPALAADPPYDAPLEATEQMAPIPTAAEMVRLVALNHGPPVDERESDITTMVVTHSVSVKLAADEEFRAYYGTSGWKSWAWSVVETADNEMYAEFGIDFVVSTYVGWDSYPDTSRSSCQLVTELRDDVSNGTSDTVAGFSKNATSGSKGCAFIGGRHTATLHHGSPTSSEEKYSQWTVQQHEFSHLFYAPDRSPEEYHSLDVMENQYEKPNYWCRNIVFSDWGYVNSNSDIFD